LKAEEEWVSSACTKIAALKPDLVITEKGLSDLAAHFLTKVCAAWVLGGREWGFVVGRGVW